MKTAALALTIACYFLSHPASADMTIEHVNVVPMTAAGDVMKDVTVVIKKDRIASITPSSTAKREPGVTAIDGRGKWLMPALADMHVHLENDRLLRLYTGDASIPLGTVRTADALLPYVANGVLQIAVLSAMPETIAQRDEVEVGRVVGPHIALAAMIDGSPPVWPIGMTRVATTASDGRQAVRDAKAEGYDLIKVYEQLNLETFLAIVDEARKQGMKVTGHLPLNNQGVTEKFFVPGFGMVAHAEELAQQTDPPNPELIEQYAKWVKRNGTWLTSTLTVDERILEMVTKPETLKTRPELHYLAPIAQRAAVERNPYLQNRTPGFIDHVQRVIDFNRKLIPIFAREGIPIVAGTDSLVPGVVPGFSLHDELESLAKAGLSNRQTLEAATRLPAEWLGTIQDRGEVVAGKRADLLLLDANPLDDVANTRRISAVIASGKWLSRADLDARMQTLRK